jgi:hypothetical protein
MKTFKRIHYLLIILFTVFAINSYAQGGGPGDPGGSPEGGGDPLGGGAPAGTGAILLTGFAIAYAGKKAYAFYKSKEKIELN